MSHGHADERNTPVSLHPHSRAILQPSPTFPTLVLQNQPSTQASTRPSEDRTIASGMAAFGRLHVPTATLAQCTRFDDAPPAIGGLTGYAILGKMHFSTIFGGWPMRVMSAFHTVGCSGLTRLAA
eukprot:352853-Chlamydomonas_euryale.AAC.6